jgi:nicotinamidase-related amidase
VEAGDPADAFITPADLPADGSLDGRTLIVDLGGLLTQSFRIARIERRGDETHILTRDEPGMTLSPGLIKLEYFPSWGIRGEARFRIPGSAVEKRRPAAMKPTPAAGNFRIHPRYVRLYTDPGVEEAERNYAHATLDWEIPAGRAAVVCVDCWAWHFSRETQERINEITEKKIAPLLAACRAAGLRVIHMPAEPVASRSKNFVRMRDPATRPQPMWPDTPAWPPAEFRGKTGPYAAYARPVEPQAEFRRHHGETLRDFHPLCRPAGEEPVLADGEDLHRYCARNGILFLIFVGFNTNACVMMRDYGIPAMNARGYETILVRDATTGMESAATVADLAGTRGTIDTIEQFLGYSIATEELVRALGSVGRP